MNGPLKGDDWKETQKHWKDCEIYKQVWMNFFYLKLFSYNFPESGICLLQWLEKRKKSFVNCSSNVDVFLQ